MGWSQSVSHWVSEWQGHLLSCLGTAKKTPCMISVHMVCMVNIYTPFELWIGSLTLSTGVHWWDWEEVTKENTSSKTTFWYCIGGNGNSLCSITVGYMVHWLYGWHRYTFRTLNGVPDSVSKCNEVIEEVLCFKDLPHLLSQPLYAGS